MTDKSLVTIDDKIEAKILENRRVFLADAVDSGSATDIIRKLWYLEFAKPGEPIYFFIHSPGGSVDSGFAIWDQIKLLTSPVTTVVTGLAASMGSVLSLVAPRGQRLATPNARVMIHQPSVHRVVGVATDLEIQANEILRTRDKLIKLYVEATGHPEEEIATALDRDKWMTAEEAMAFGLIDRIVTNVADLTARA